MNLYFITGTGSGIGHAIALKLLKDKNNTIIGISRNNTINHPQFHHITADLADISNLKTSVTKWFEISGLVQKATLINNAGTVGEIGYVGNLSSNHFDKVFNLNVTAPTILINEFISHFRNQTFPKVILNISSGAGKYPVDGWAAYCASKAAIDLFSVTIMKEEEIRKNGFHIFSIAPGIVDTPMQEIVRTTSSDNFSNVQKFIDYKEKNQLISPELVADKLILVTENPSDYTDCILDVRKI